MVLRLRSLPGFAGCLECGQNTAAAVAVVVLSISFARLTAFMLLFLV